MLKVEEGMERWNSRRKQEIGRGRRAEEEHCSPDQKLSACSRMDQAILRLFTTKKTCTRKNWNKRRGVGGYIDRVAASRVGEEHFCL